MRPETQIQAKSFFIRNCSDMKSYLFLIILTVCSYTTLHSLPRLTPTRSDHLSAGHFFLLKGSFFFPQSPMWLAHTWSSECWAFLCIIEGFYLTI